MVRGSPRALLLLLLLRAAGARTNASDAEDCALTAERPWALIPGAVKAGSTAMHSALVAALGVGGRKEVYYFNDDAAYARGGYGRLLGCGAGPRIDGSPMYLAHPRALGRAARDAPWAKWVVMLREPVDRAFSHVTMLRRFAGPAVSGGREAGFLAAVEAEAACLEAALARSRREGAAADTKRAFAACVKTPLGGDLAALAPRGKLALYGVRHGVLSQSLYAPQLAAACDAIRAAGAEATIIAVSQRALYDDGPATARAVLDALGVPGAAVPAAIRTYESLSGDREASAVRPGDTYVGHRRRIPAAALGRLDALYRRPNCALADALRDAKIAARVGLGADAWLSDCEGEL